MSAEVIKIKAKGQEYDIVRPYSCEIGEELAKQRFCGYSLNPVFENMTLKIFYKSGNFFDRKKVKIVDIMFDINTQNLTYIQYGFKDEHNSISLWKEIVALLRPTDELIVGSKTKNGRVFYTAKAAILEGFINKTDNEKFIHIPKAEFKRFRAKRNS